LNVSIFHFSAKNVPHSYSHNLCKTKVETNQIIARFLSGDRHKEFLKYYLAASKNKLGEEDFFNAVIKKQKNTVK